MFSIIGFCVKKILRIIGSQIQRENIFFSIGIFIILRGCHLVKNLDKLIFVNKNWPNDPKISYKSPFSLVELIEIDVDLEKEIEEFEGAFERDEVMEF
jgi:hypothetical protein